MVVTGSLSLEEGGEAALSALGELAGAISNLSPEALSGLSELIKERGDLPEDCQYIATFLAARTVNRELTGSAVFGLRPTELSPVLLPVGFRSPDGSAVLGREGYLFLVGGSNDVLSQFSYSEETVEALASRWMELFEARSRSAEALNMRYLQVVVPEKISVLDDLYPGDLKAPSPLLASLEERLSGDQFAGMHLPAYSILRGGIRRQVYRKTDSHLTPRGAHLLFKSLVRTAAGYDLEDMRFTRRRHKLGDLALRLMGFHLAEEVYEVPETELPTFVEGAVKASELLPGSGGHKGRNQTWRNEQAPIQKTLVVFGNSFFSFAEYGQSALSWWASRWFRDYHFVWTNEVDFEYAKSVGADIVVWQGVERFLPIHSGV